MNKFWKIIFYTTLGFILLLTALPFLQGTLNFHTDIARDFMLLEDVYFNKNITLIGPRSGGIPGVFHGPLWLYLNLPAYILGNGNPVVVAWFWFLLFFLSIGAMYYVGKKMFGSKSAVISLIIFASAMAVSVQASFNPSGAVYLFPLFYFFLWKYINDGRCIDLGLGLFILGCIIQFQMAFGVPILILVLPLILYFIWKRKQFKHIVAFLLLAVPTSSYILFELRHDFLQVHSIINYLSGVENTGKEDISSFMLLKKRLGNMSIDSFGMITYYNVWLSLSAILVSIITIVKNSKKHYLKDKYFLFLYLFVGYWLITLLYRGVLWGYYFWPFVGGLVLIIGSSYHYLHNRLVTLFFIILIASNMYHLYDQFTSAHPYQGWIFNKEIAEKIFADAPKEFGYFIYTTDQFGYPMRYAMSQTDRIFQEKPSFSDEKRAVTYLLIDDPKDNKYINSIDWKLYDVRINRQPDSIENITNTFRIEKYILTDEELQTPSNPNLLQSIFFR